MTRPRAHAVALALVSLLIVAYGVYFSAVSIQRHRAFLTNASDLGQIDQAIWNTLQGRPLEFTRRTGEQSIRLTDHVEPIFIPASLVLLVYDNVEALLVLQSFVIALGALPVFWIARRRLASEWAGVAFAGIYLLFPSLEAANLAEFHAVTFAPLLLLLMYHYGTLQKWGRFALFALLALAVKEEIALLVMVMAGWLAVTKDGRRTTNDERLIGSFRRSETSSPATKDFRHSSLAIRQSLIFSLSWQPAVIAVIALVWFVLALFVIIPHFNTLGKSPYTCRYVVSEDCREVVPGLFLAERLGYLGQLLASSGWIALLDPLSLLLGAPLIIANVLSNYPAQYSGSFHYSAPVVPYFILGAIGGTAWLKSRLARLSLVLIPVLLLALGYHLLAGYTPLGAAYRVPAITARNLLFQRFAAQIPDDARVSTTPSLHPHLSHRRVLYRYPVVNDADYVMLDVSESDRGIPVDFRVKYNELVDGGAFGVIDAADGYVLLKRGAPPRPLPDAFFTLFRGDARAIQHRVEIDFGDKVRLLGFDLLTDAYGRGALRTYWQRLKPLDRNYFLFPFIADAAGAPVADLNYPMTVLFWYPSAGWQADEVVVAKTISLDWGEHARIGVGVVDGSDWSEIGRRLPAQPHAPDGLRPFEDNTWVELGVAVKRDGQYILEK